MGSRGVHFVGSFPGEGTDDAMWAMLDAAGPRLRTLPTGETRRYEWYIQPIIDDLVSQGALEVKKPGTWQTSRDRTIHRVPRGKELTGDMMELGYLGEAEEALPIFQGLRAARDLPELALQIGMPTDFTLTFIAMGVSGIRPHRKAFHDATVRDIAAIHKLVGDDVVVQLEARVSGREIAADGLHGFGTARFQTGDTRCLRPDMTHGRLFRHQRP